MTDSGAEGRRVPKRFRRLKFNPLRDVLPLVAVLGCVHGCAGVVGVSNGGEPLLIYVGSGLVVVGVAMFFINRWQAKRGL